MRRSNWIFKKETTEDGEYLQPMEEALRHYTLRGLQYTTGTLHKDEAEADAVAEVLYMAARCPEWPKEGPVSITDDPDDPWVYLAGAIVMQAAQDYCEAVMHGYKEDRKDCEAFFHSDFFHRLTMLEPDTLMARLDAEAAERKSWGLRARKLNYDGLFRK